MEARRVRSIEMKPFQRIIYFLVMKIVVPRFGKRDTTSYMDLIYMDHIVSKRLVNLPRVMMRHMSYVILVKDHELPYGDWMTMIFEAFGVPLVDKQGEEPKRYDYIEETFLSMCQLKRKNGVWWLGSVEVEEPSDEAPPMPIFPASLGDSTNRQKEPEAAGVDPLGPSGHIPDSIMSKLQVDFERAPTNRITVDLEKAQEENARLLALLQQAQS
ncbi:hypothetical protein Dimus_013165 [Dionaea muscipula]